MTVSTSSHESLICLAEFGHSLTTTGELTVKKYLPNQSFDQTGFDVFVSELDLLNRTELPSGAPKVDFPSALWSAKKIYTACQFLVCREESEAILRAALNAGFPSSRSPATDYSADLFFQYLPDLFAISNRIAPGDALTQVLSEWAFEWPLSSVGIPLGRRCETHTFETNAALLRLYVDRVVERVAKDRLENPIVCDVLKRDSGLYPELIPFLPSAYSHA